MRLGGWSRLGIVISVLYGVVVAFISYESRPRLEYLQMAWFADASATIAKAISKSEGKGVEPYDVRKALFKNEDAETISWLEKAATSPSEFQKVFSAEIARVNERHKALIAALPELQREHWLLSFLWWVGGTVLLFGTGWTARWIYRGFHRGAA